MDNAGKELKKIRLEKGISLEEAQKKTKIHANILKAIEGDGLTNLNPVYLKGFLKIYCKYLGVEPKDYILDYKETQTSPDITNPPRQISKNLSESATFFRNVRVKLNTLRPDKRIRTFLIFFSAIVVLWVVFFNAGKIISSRRSDNLQAKTSAPSKAVKAATPKAQNSSPGKTTPSVSKPKTSQSKIQKQNLSGIKLVIRAHGNCWVSLKIDGKLVFHSILEKGRFESWQAKDKMELTLGDAGAVELSVNSQTFSKLGRKGQSLKNILITKEGLTVSR